MRAAINRPEAAAALAVVWLAILVGWGVTFDTPQGALSGRVLEPDGKTPIAGARVWVEGWQPGAARVSMLTGRDGSYRAVALPVARYQVRAVAPGWEMAYSKPIQIEEADEFRGVDLELQKREPDFSLYSSRHCFTPEERAALWCDGYLPERKIAFTLYRVTLERYLAKIREPKQYALPWHREALAGLGPERQWVEPVRRVDRDFGTFSMRVRLPKLRPGMYIVNAEAAGRTRQVSILVTRLAMVTKSAPDKLLAYVVDMLDNRPAAGVSIVVENRWRAGAIARGETDSEGTCVLPAATHGDFVAVASLGDSQALCEGQCSYPRSGLEVYMFTDRPIYRPGHEVYYKGIVRTNVENGYELPSRRDFFVVVRDPEGDTTHKTAVELSDMGSFDGKFTLDEEAKVGHYSLCFQHHAESRVALASTSFEVQEYRKPEYRVEVDIPKRHYPGGETITASVRAQYYFGAPVAGAEVEYRVYTSGWYWPFESVGGERLWRYSFGGWSPGCDAGEYNYEEEFYGYGELLAEGKTRTDENGAAVVRVDTKPVLEHQRVVIEVDVTDLSRKTVSANASTALTPGNFALGMATQRWIYEPGDQVGVEALAVDYEGKPVPKVRITWAADERKWKRTKYACTRVGSGEVKTDKEGKATFSFTARKAGNYVIRAEARDDAGRRIGCAKYLWVASETFSADYRYPTLELVADKKEYEPGETARVMINSDSPASPVLVTVERDRLYSYQVLSEQAASRLVDVPVAEEYQPNVTVMACYLKGSQFVENALTLKVSAKKHFLDVSIRTDEPRYHPGDQVTYQVETRDAQGRGVPAEVTLGIVDEAIYALRPDTTPKMREFFYGHWHNRVYTNTSLWHYYSAGEDKFAGVKVRKYFPDTAFWAASVQTDEQGLAEVQVRLPDNITSWRATARAHTAATQVGEARWNILARKDLMVRISTPRFMTQRDEVTVAGLVHNYTDARQRVQVDFDVKGARLLNRGRGEAVLDPNSSTRFDWRLRAEQPGEAVLTMRAVAGRASDGMEVGLPVLPHGAPVIEGQSGEIERSAVMAVNLPEDASTGTASLKVWLTPSLAATLLQSLKYLADYPYGCIEQTLSRFVPTLAVVRALRVSGQRDPALEAELPKMVRAGVKRVCEMQNPDGGWGWYLDDSRPETTAHALYGLATARAEGFEVPQECVRRGVNWLSQRLKPLDVEVPEHQDTRELERLLREKAWSVHALALAGQAPRKDLDELYRGRRYLNAYGLALLALSMHDEGDARAPQVVRDMLRLRQEHERTIHWTSDLDDYSWWDSDLEATAYALMALLRVDPLNPAAGKAARWLVLGRKGDRWQCTKTTATVLYAMAEYMESREAPSPRYTVKVTLGGRERQIDVTSLTPAEMKEPITFGADALKTGRNVMRIERSEGPGALYYTALFSYETGQEDVPTQLRGMTVHRGYDVLVAQQDPKAGLVYVPRPIRGPLKAGQMIRVRLSVTTSVHYRYVVVEDHLPSGFEVVDSEGMQMAVSRGEETIKGRKGRAWKRPWWHREVHGDKVAFFATSLGKGRYRTTYFLRAEMPGALHVMPTQVFGMYEPEAGGSSAESRVTVRAQ